MNAIEAASAYLAAEDKITEVSQRVVETGAVMGAGILCVGGVVPMARALYYGRRVKQKFEAMPELVPRELQGELVTARDKAEAILGMPVGDSVLMEKFYE